MLSGLRSNSGEEVWLRPIVPDDEALLCRIYSSTRTEELAVTGWTEVQKQAFLTGQFQAQQQYYYEHYTDTDYAVVMVGDAPAGRLYVGRWPDEIRIVDIALLPAYRRGGIGTALINALQDEARSRNVRVSIHVEVFNPARRLYERLGFETVEDKGVYQFMLWFPSSSS